MVLGCWLNIFIGRWRFQWRRCWWQWIYIRNHCIINVTRQLSLRYWHVFFSCNFRVWWRWCLEGRYCKDSWIPTNLITVDCVPFSSRYCHYDITRAVIANVRCSFGWASPCLRFKRNIKIITSSTQRNSYKFLIAETNNDSAFCYVIWFQNSAHTSEWKPWESRLDTFLGNGLPLHRIYLLR